MRKAVWDGKTSGKADADFDCYIAEALLSEGRRVGSVEETMLRYKVSTIEDLANKQQEKFDKNPQLSSLFHEVEMMLVPILDRMEKQGILLDTKKLSTVGKKIDELVVTVKEKIDKETNGVINLNSPTQLGQFLADKMLIPLSKTKTGKYATGVDELSKFKDQFPIIANILTYRELTKLRSTYVESLIQKVETDGRVHTTYTQVGVNTGRLSSSNPNLQNIPVTSAIGQEIKSCFVASPGYTFVSFDYSQQELRILAHLAQEQKLIEAFKNNRDVHTLTASALFHVPYEKVTKQQRAVGKTINFGIIYGMSSWGMSAGLNIPQKDSEAFIKQFYVSYPNIKTFYDNYFEEAKKNDHVETILGRRRYVFEDPKRRFIDNTTRRVLMNYPIQGSAADLMKKAMVDVQNKVLTKHSDIHLLLQIHDDLVFEIPDKDSKKQNEVIAAIQSAMCTAYPLSIPVVVDVKMGKQWGNLQTVDRK